jgi:hypothetical protein
MFKQYGMMCVAVLLLAIPTLADGTVTLSLTSPSNGQDVTAGAAVTWTITAEVSTGDNLGLALISVDLVQDAMNPELMDIPVADAAPGAMSGFALPGGVTNPAGYPGTQVGDGGQLNLAQIGGGQNIFGQAGPTGVGQDVNVDTGIGQGVGGQVIATGSFDAPTTEGIYSFSIANAVANTLETVQSPPLNSTATQADVVYSGDTITFTVVPGSQCCPCVGDVSPGYPNCDNVVDVSDFGAFAASFGKSVGSPGYNPCADLSPPGGDGTVDVSDFGAFATQFGKPCP